MKLSDLVDAYLNPYPAGLVLDESTVSKLLKEAVRFYAGYATLSGLEPAEPPTGDGIHSDFGASSDITADDIEINQSEWAIIKPLFDRYVEKENATHLEASRGMGVDVFGRTVAEIQLDINQLELEMPQKAFEELAFTV